MPGFLERDEGEREPPCDDTRGTASAASDRTTVSRRRRRSGCIERGERGHLRASRITEQARVCLRYGNRTMLHLPVLRWGQPYTSLDIDKVVHFATGEPIAKVSRANGGLIQRDMRKAQRARDVLREIPIDDLIDRVGKAGELYMNGDAADGRRHADARRVRPRAVGDAPACPSACAART